MLIIEVTLVALLIQIISILFSNIETFMLLIKFGLSYMSRITKKDKSLIYHQRIFAVVRNNNSNFYNFYNHNIYNFYSFLNECGLIIQKYLSNDFLCSPYIYITNWQHKYYLFDFA